MRIIIVISTHCQQTSNIMAISVPLFCACFERQFVFVLSLMGNLFLSLCGLGVRQTALGLIFGQITDLHIYWQVVINYLLKCFTKMLLPAIIHSRICLSDVHVKVEFSGGK